MEPSNRFVRIFTFTSARPFYCSQPAVKAMPFPSLPSPLGGWHGSHAASSRLPQACSQTCQILRWKQLGANPKLSPLLKLFIYLHILERQSDKQIFHSLVHAVNIHKHPQVRVRSKPEAQNSTGAPRVYIFGPSSPAAPPGYAGAGRGAWDSGLKALV